MDANTDTQEPVVAAVRNELTVPRGALYFTTACFAGPGKEWSLAPLQEPGDVKKNRAIELTIKPENVIVVCKDSTTQNAFAEPDRWSGTRDAQRRRSSSGTFYYIAAKTYALRVSPCPSPLRVGLYQGQE